MICPNCGSDDAYVLVSQGVNETYNAAAICLNCRRQVSINDAERQAAMDRAKELFEGAE